MIVKADKVEDLLTAVKKNLDGYGACVVGSAILVMSALDAGASLDEAHDEMSSQLTGFQAGAVASIVSQLSPRGDEFRRWWNLRTQIGKEGELANAKEGAVLNPALLTIDSKEVDKP